MHEFQFQHISLRPIKSSIFLAGPELLWFSDSLTSQQSATDSEAAGCHRLRFLHLTTDVQGDEIPTSFIIYFFLSSLQPPGLWLHLGHAYAQDGPGRLRPPRRLHGSQGLARAEGILQIPGEGLRREEGRGLLLHSGGGKKREQRRAIRTETLSCVWKWQMWGPITSF